MLNILKTIHSYTLSAFFLNISVRRAILCLLLWLGHNYLIIEITEILLSIITYSIFFFTIFYTMQHVFLFIMFVVFLNSISLLLFTSVSTYFLSFYTAHEVLTASILEWFAVPSSSESRFVRTLRYDQSYLEWLLTFIDLCNPVCHDKAVIREGREIKPVDLKGNQPWILVWRTDDEAETLVFWSYDANSWLIGKVFDARKDWGQEKRVSEDEIDEWHQRCNGHELGQTLGDGEGQRSLVCCSPWGGKESDLTG